MRDIFLRPFNSELLGCVAGMYFIMLIAMATVIYAAKTALHDDDEKHVGIGEATLWCFSIMCMQGFFHCVKLSHHYIISLNFITCKYDNNIELIYLAYEIFENFSIFKLVQITFLYAC